MVKLMLLRAVDREKQIATVSGYISDTESTIMDISVEDDADLVFLEEKLLLEEETLLQVDIEKKCLVLDEAHY